MEVHLRGHKGDQAQEGDVRARTRDAIHDPQSECRAKGGAVSLMVELLSCHPTLPDRAPLSAYREGRQVKVLKDDQALRRLREVVEKLGLRCTHCGLDEPPPSQPGETYRNGLSREKGGGSQRRTKRTR